MYHHWLYVLPVLSTVLLANLATPPVPLWGNIRVMHAWNSVPANWESLGPSPVGTTINLHIALKPRHETALIDALYEVSDPSHRKYGAHLSKEQVAELVAPHQDTLKTVHSWLEHHGVPSSSISTSHGGGWLTITGVPVSQANELLCASYQLYRHTETDETNAILRTVSYALPLALHAHVQTVVPTTHFDSPRTQLQTPRNRPNKEAAAVANATSEDYVLSRRDGYVSPPFLRWLYKTQAYVPSAMDRNVIGTLGFLNDNPSQADLTQFMKFFRADAEAATFTGLEVNGGRYDPSPSYAGGGANIHMQYSGAMAYPTPQIFYSTGGDLQWFHNSGAAAGDAYLEWLNYLIAQPNIGIARTISTSYVNPEKLFPKQYTTALCDLFAQLGARGISVLVASGDNGVGAIEDCTSHRGRVKFTPMFPASCPWVTSVGGTTGHEPEFAAAFSGGGFSFHFRRPKYQDYTMPPYLQFLGNDKYKGLYYRMGRGIPDIAAQAQRYAHVLNTVFYEASGTTCSTSTVAGIVSLLNDYQVSKGRAPLGFLNPWLYRFSPVGFNDITSGSNPGCNTDGFTAIEGWDPVTGLGTLNFEILQHKFDTLLHSSATTSTTTVATATSGSGH